MNETFFISIVTTGFLVAFAHAAIPTHWLPFVLAGRGQRWSKATTLMVVALCGSGHVLFTTLLGVLLVWLGIETSKWTGNVFPWIAGSALILFGLYYLVRQVRGDGHGHSHFGGGHSHEGHDHGGHVHAAESKRIDTGHGMLVLEIYEDGVPPRFWLRSEGGAEILPLAADLSLETLRPGGVRQVFTFTTRDDYLESTEEIPEPHEFTACLSLSHGAHTHRHEVRFEEHDRPATLRLDSANRSGERSAAMVKSDRTVIVGLFTLLTFSPCEGFLPIYLSGIKYGWAGFFVLSAVLAFATIAGMVIFTWLTMSGMERLRLGVLERYESGILGALILFLGLGIIFLGF